MANKAYSVFQIWVSKYAWDMLKLRHCSFYHLKLIVHPISAYSNLKMWITAFRSLYRDSNWALSNSAPTPTHPQPPKIMSRPPKKNHTHSKYYLTNRQSHKTWSNNPHLLKLLFDRKVKQRYELETYFQFHRMCMPIKLGRMDGDLGW